MSFLFLHYFDLWHIQGLLNKRKLDKKFVRAFDCTTKPEYYLMIYRHRNESTKSAIAKALNNSENIMWTEFFFLTNSNRLFLI